MLIVQMMRIFAVALVLVLAATGLWAGAASEEEPAAAADKETVFDPATGMTWTAPEYGGTLTWAATAYPENADHWWVSGWAHHFVGGVNERLAFANWALSRDIWNGRDYAVVTPEMTTGALAESWSMPDDTTFIWNIRKGVYWDDKEPVNGREFDAYDVEHNYHRYFGLGDFTEAGPSAHTFATTWGVGLESVTATDKWTVVMKLTEPTLDVLGKLLNPYWVAYAPEVIEKYGDAKDWRNLVGTGPWRLTEYVDGSSVTWEKNPNYWGYDEKFPENRLPYIDELRSLMMPEMSARLAAFRTGKIDVMGNFGDSWIYNVDDLDTLERTNPEIEVWPFLGAPAGVFVFNWALPPTDDPIVRKALQMSVDREVNSASFFKGYGDPAPAGLMRQDLEEGWAWPYEEWPEEVKQEYTYNPERAEELLDEAGYPRGADGYRFKLKVRAFERYTTDYAELIMGYFDAIGVEGELVPQTIAEHNADNSADTHEWALVQGGYNSGSSVTTWNPMKGISQNFGWSYNKAKDPRMDALYLASQETTDMEEYRSLLRQADEITVREHWGLVKSKSPKFSVSQPWVEGYFGEAGMGWGERNTVQARIWIDSELKNAMGR